MTCNQETKDITLTFKGLSSRKLQSLLQQGYEISGASLYHPAKHQHCFCTQAGFVGWFQGEEQLGNISKDKYLNAMSFITKYLQEKYSIDNLTAKAIARQISELGEDYRGMK